MSDSQYSRRDFIVRAGQIGGALSVLAPTVRLAGAMVPAGAFAASEYAPIDPTLYSGLSWRMLGPFRGGRCPAATGVPGRPNEFYFGHANGGVWKTIDAGRVWTPVFDSQPVASIGAIAVSPSSPDVVYVGTGESTLRDSTGYGNGVYRSNDAGRTWTHLGLDDSQHIGKIAIDPKNPNVAFVAAIGKLYAASPERGVFRTRDGGKTWQKVLFKNDDVGAVEVVIDPTNSNVVYAASRRNTRRPPGIPTRRRTAPAAASSSRPTAARRGISSPRDFPPARRDASVSPSRRAALGACTRSSIACPPTAACFARTTPAPRGQSCRATTRSGDAAGTSRRSQSIRRTPTSSTCRTSPSRGRWTAAKRGSRCAAHPAATTIISRGCRPTIRTR